MKLIIDTDPGVDDAMAYFYAHARSGMEIIALTTVFGNVTVEDATKNALWLTEFSNASQVKVYQGAAKPLSITPNPVSSEVHGEHGFGDIEIGEVSSEKQDEPAADYLVKAAREAPGEITVCAIGPLTNIALAVQKDPEFVSNLKQLVIMGGALDASGNVTEFAEANFWNDPHAADIVVNAPGDGKIVIVGLDVTDRIAFTPQDFIDIEKASEKVGGFLNDIGKFYMAFYQSRSGRFACSLHDPSAVIATELPELFSMESTPLSVITEGEKIGMLQRREGKGRKCHVCLNGDFDGIVQQFKEIVSENP